MGLPDLVSLDELAAWMGGSAALPVNAANAISAASSIVRGECRQRLTRETTTVTLRPRAMREFPFTHCIDLTQRPIVSVDSLLRDGAAVDYVQRGECLYLHGGCPVTLTYTHGYVDIPWDIKSVVLGCAMRILSNPHDLRQETAGSVSVTYAAETIGASLSPADKDVLARYRRRVAVVRMT